MTRARFDTYLRRITEYQRRISFYAEEIRAIVNMMAVEIADADAAAEKHDAKDE